MLTEELGQLRGDVDVLLTERKERDKTKNAPVDWAALTEEQAAVQWPILARWVGEVLVPRYELTRDELPDCWALHPPVVAELSWLRTAYVQAYLTRSPPQLSADWHTRWRPAVLTRIRELIKPDECAPGKHAPRRGTPVEAWRRRTGRCRVRSWPSRSAGGRSTTVPSTSTWRCAGPAPPRASSTGPRPQASA